MISLLLQEDMEFRVFCSLPNTSSNRAGEIAELRLHTEEQLRDWREKRRRGAVKVKWNQFNLDNNSELVEMKLDKII